VLSSSYEDATALIPNMNVGRTNNHYSPTSVSPEQTDFSTDYEYATSFNPNPNVAVTFSQTMGNTYERADSLGDDFDSSLYAEVGPVSESRVSSCDTLPMNIITLTV